MLKTKVIAAGIEHLTDARYFAARGADYLLYNLDKISIEDAVAIQNWVSGIQAIIENPGKGNIFQLLENWDNLSIHSVIVSPGSAFKVPVHSQSIQYINSIDKIFNKIYGMGHSDEYIYKTDRIWSALTDLELDELSKASLQHKIYIQNPGETVSIVNQIETFPVYGLVLEGSPEEKTGVKSYDKLDRIFNQLEM